MSNIAAEIFMSFMLVTVYHCKLISNYNISAQKGTMIYGTKIICMTVGGTSTVEVLKSPTPRNKIHINQLQHKNFSSCMWKEL
jgi:hypothetical protein